jgi:hypothetical protein
MPPDPIPRLPLWKLEMFREQAERRRNARRDSYMQAEQELQALINQIEERRQEQAFAFAQTNKPKETPNG